MNVDLYDTLPRHLADQLTAYKLTGIDIQLDPLTRNSCIGAQKTATRYQLEELPSL
jgi:hypothetical protein